MRKAQPKHKRFDPVSYVHSLGRAGMDFHLERMRRAMEKLGSPQNCYPCIHVAGTNGKGSVTALIASALAEAGYNVGMYTSPHLEKLNERFQFNGQHISDSDLARLVRRVKSVASLTQFEFLTAVAFQWFADKKVDVAVIEVGLGGRLDATNVVQHVLAAVITNIDLDHTQWLGSTHAEIAYEKAGIIKPFVPVVTGATGAALDVIRRIANANQSPLTVVSPTEKGLATPLIGIHQKHNSAIAEQTVRLLPTRGFPIAENSIKRGFARVRWPGRYESFQIGTGKNRIRVILDGAHNPAGMRTLSATLKSEKIKKVTLLFGALKDKDINELVTGISELTSRCITVTVPSERSASAAMLAKRPQWKGKAESAASIEKGFARAVALASNQPAGRRTLVVAGSLYLIGEVRKLFSARNKKGILNGF